MIQCSNVLMIPCSNVPMFQCSNVPMFQSSNVPMFHCSKSNIKYQMSIRLNFCRSVLPEFLRSFFSLSWGSAKKGMLKCIQSLIVEWRWWSSKVYQQRQRCCHLIVPHPCQWSMVIPDDRIGSSLIVAFSHRHTAPLPLCRWILKLIGVARMLKSLGCFGNVW